MKGDDILKAINKDKLMASSLFLWLLLATVLIGFMMFAPVRPEEASAEVVPTLQPETHIITANGQAAVILAPDMATLSIGVTTESDDVLAAQKENARKMGAVTERLKSDGVREEDIETSSYSISPKRTWDELRRESIITGYTVSNVVSVTVNDISGIGEIIDGVVAVGGNQINGINFGIEDESTYYNQALELAVKDAKEKAVAMGKGVGAQNIKAVRITESGSRNQPIYYESMKSMDMAVEQTIPILEGELEIRANVIVEFEYNY